MNTELDTRTARKYISLKQSAHTRGIVFDLSLVSVRNMLKAKRCAYTGIQLNDVENHPHSRTIDRVDNNKGYITGNVVACCKRINTAKGNLTINELSSILSLIDKRGL